jgi:two-component system C4-dicarboxylate transport sensor histidine kinase DctB
MPSRSLSRTTWFAILGATLLSGLILWETARYARSVALDEIRTRSAYTLDLVVENLRGELAKYSFQPRLLAHSTVLTDALTQYPQASAMDRANSELERINEVTGARATYLMNKDGLTIAASNWSSDKPFVGSNFSFRPYFKEAMQGRLGRFSALGTTSGERGYYFAHPVRNADGIIGVVVVKMGVARLETAWRASDDIILILDEEGIVFLSSRPEWRLNAISPLSAAAHQRLSETRRYAGEAHRELSFSRAPDSDIIEIGKIDAPSTSNRTKKYLAISAPMNEAGWRVLILADASGVAYRVQIALLVVGFMLASAVLASLNIYQRRRRLNERLELQEAAKA